jgi:2-phosphoglycerate kinase
MKRKELRVERSDNHYAFSLGEVVESLQGAGVPTDTAIKIARVAEKHYREKHISRVTLDKLVSHIARLIEQELGKDIADRFRVQTPPFVPIEVQKDTEIKPFSRKLLTRSLEKLKLSFKDAYAIAGQVEQSLRSRGYEMISALELSHLIASVLEAALGRDARLRYEASHNSQADLMVVEASGASFPFSRGILAQSLMAIGLGPELSYTMAKHIEELLWRKGEVNLPRRRLHEEVRHFLEREAGEEFATRFDIMRSVRKPEKPVIILVGGAPGVGKSTMAAELAYRLGINRIVSSDAVREALRSLISPQLSPSLHHSSFTAWRADLLPTEANAKPKRKRVTRGFVGQAQQLSTALIAIISRNIQEGSSVIVEGIHLVPGLLPTERTDDATILEFVLVLADEKRHKSHFINRHKDTGQKRHQDKYLSHFEEIRLIHDYLHKQAQTEGVATIDTANFDVAVEQALELVLSASLRQGVRSRYEENITTRDDVV